MDKINNKEAIGLILTLIINNFVFISSQILIQTCSSSSIINTIYISIIALIVSIIICLMFKKFEGQDILDISDYLGGKPLKFIIGFIFISFFIFSISVMLRKLVNCLQIIYYPFTDIVYIILLFLIATGIICSFKNNAIPKVIKMLIPLFFFCLFAALFGNIKNFDFQAIYPILGYGNYTTFFIGLSNLYGFYGLGYIFFLPSKMENPKKLKKVVITSIILSAILCVVSIIPVLFMFNNSLNNGEVFPLYIAIRYIEFGSFFQRLDSAFLMIAVIAFCVTLSIVTKLCIDIFQKITQISDKKPIIYPILLFIFSISTMINNSFDSKLLESKIYIFTFFIVVIGIGPFTLLLANIKKSLKLKGIKNE